MNMNKYMLRLTKKGGIRFSLFKKKANTNTKLFPLTKKANIITNTNINIQTVICKYEYKYE